MLKQFLNSGSIKALMLFDKDADGNEIDPKVALREQLAKGNVTPPNEPEEDEEEADTEEGQGEDVLGEEEAELDDDGNPIKKIETAEEKTAREALETEAAKAKRKEERVQKRIDKAVAAQRIAENEVVKLKEQLAANPDKTLTEEEIQRRADVIANEKVAAKEVERLQIEFNKACDKLQDAGNKLDKEFTPKVNEMAAELGPIPSRIIGILADLDNGHEVLKFMVDDIDEAEKLYDLKDRPERLAIALVRIADKLEAAKIPPKKQISQVPDAVKPVNGSRVNTTQITAKDTTPAGMDNYVRKRQQQMEQRRKQGR